MTSFIFFGRLVPEKGVDMILNVFTTLYEADITDWTLDIYGAGSLHTACQNAANLFPKNIFFHGWGEHTHVMNILREKDFCLMPSLIIETFGLSALESLRKGVPVIGFKKGGTEPFVSEALNIEAQDGISYTEKLYNLISNILSTKKEKSSYLPAIDFAHYTPGKRLAQFEQIAGGAKRILLVSDFTRRVGGVENYIHDVHDLLRDNGYIVGLRGMDKKNSFAGLFKTALHISAWLKLGSKIDSFKPDLVWTHSVMREIGRFPLTVIPHDMKTIMMFHDMGYFYPYPSSLTTLETLPKDASLRERIRVGKKNDVLSQLLLSLKWLALRAIKSVFQTRPTTYLVPSEFMKPFSERLWQGKKQETITFPHFVK